MRYAGFQFGRVTVGLVVGEGRTEILKSQLFIVGKKITEADAIQRVGFFVVETNGQLTLVVG